MLDLHLHSTFSDGSDTPEELIAMAADLNLSAVALTDHDTTGGVARFSKAGEEAGVRTISGVEISAEFQPGTMHILGYFIDCDDRDLNDHLRWIRDGREARNREILHKLMTLGCHITWDEVASQAGEDVVGRPHFAKVLISKGYVSDKKEAFNKYLARGKPAYADRRRLSPEDSILLIRKAGGIPVLAHPFTLFLGRWDLRKLLCQLREDGLEGLEVYNPEHTREMQREYRKLAKSYNLVATGGTDYHGEGSPDITMGRGFGSLNVPDDVVRKLEERLANIA